MTRMRYVLSHGRGYSLSRLYLTVLNCMEGGDIGSFFTLVPMVFSLFDWLITLGTLMDFGWWFIKLSFQMFQLLTVICRKGEWFLGCTSIQRPLSYHFRSLTTKYIYISFLTDWQGLFKNIRQKLFILLWSKIFFSGNYTAKKRYTACLLFINQTNRFVPKIGGGLKVIFIIKG